MKTINVVFGNHNTANAVEDYLFFTTKSVLSISRNIIVSKLLVPETDIVVIQEDFSKKEALELVLFAKSSKTKKLVVIATENIQGDSFNDFLEFNKIVEKNEYLKEMAVNQLKSDSLPSFLYKKYFSRTKRDFKGWCNILNRVRNDHLGVLAKRYLQFLKVAPHADQIWLMPGLNSAPYIKLFGDKVHPFPFIVSNGERQLSNVIRFCALLSGKLSPHRMKLLNYLGLEQPRTANVENSWNNLIITSSFDIPLSIRRQMLSTAGVYLDLPVSDGSQIFSSMKAVIALEASIPFFALTEADPGKFAPFVRTFTDIHTLKNELHMYSKEELAEMGAQFSSGAAKVFTPSAYPFLEELLK
jgi:hypothetical protein